MNRYDIALGKKPPPKPDTPTVVFTHQVKTTAAPNPFYQESRSSLTLGSTNDLIRDSVRRSLNQSFARRIFNVEVLPNGALPIYDKNPETPVYIMAEDGEDILTVVRPQRVILPIFSIRSAVQRHTFSHQQSQVNRVIDNDLTLILLNLVRQEETKAIRLLNGADIECFNITNIGNFNAVLLFEAMSFIEERDLRVASILMNNQDFLIVRYNFSGVYDNSHNQWTVCQTGQSLREGIIGSMFGTDLSISSNVPRGQIYIFSEPQHVGVLAERSFECNSAEDPMRLETEYSFVEQIGMGILYPRNVVKILVN